MAANGCRARQETTLRHAGLQANRSKVQNAIHAKDHITQPAKGPGEGCQDHFVKAVRSTAQATGFREFSGVRIIDHQSTMQTVVFLHCLRST